MEKKPQKQTKQTAKDTVWVTYKDDNGQIKSAPLEIFQEIAKKRGWKTQPTDWNT